MKLTVLMSIKGRLSQNMEMPVALNSECESRSRQWDGLSQITLSEMDDGLEPRAFQYIPPPSPLRSSPLIWASTPSSQTE